MKKIYLVFIIIILFIHTVVGASFAIIDTNMGKFKIRLYKKDAPVTVKNFIRYARNDKFDGAIFYRIIDDFIIQGGGYKLTKGADIEQIKEYKPIKSEADNGLYNIKKSIAMARDGNNPHSATNNFFINLKFNKELNYGYTKDLKKSYTVFGKIVDGWKVIKKISTIKTNKKGKFDHYPIKNIIIEDVIIKKSQ